MKIIVNTAPKQVPKFEFRKGGVYRDKETGGVYLCCNLATSHDYNCLRMLELHSCDRMHEACLPEPDPTKWEEVEATLTISNK